ncbi:hypothetical protein BU23DRAFT_574884 [Bimuria novae-zelandiae CBS 107.79]|uniref:Uncharacterized protein n=1 Tax=Bimuria novae-zelandiae CBS 107.79 TaxID=1447943 RepID=A0A6A5UNQ2_9PLEO|nr:hypothetical protein BU23DRAFT_574884 [Bimuria novae-zelandiae CBS 107.79]
MRVSTVVLGLVALSNCVGEAYGRAVFGNDVLAPSLRVGLTELTERSGKEPNTELPPVHAAPHLSTTGEAAGTLVERGRGARKAKSSRKKTKTAKTRKAKGSGKRKKIAKSKKPKSGTSKTKPPKRSTSKTPKPTKTKQQASVKLYPG